MASATVFGCTGAVGSHILTTLLTNETFTTIKTISRRLPKAESSKLEAIQEADTSKWGSMISALSPQPSVIFNAVGTTRAIAGGIQNQWKIDHDLCIENAKAAKAAGVKTYVFISSAGTRGLLSAYVPYSKMKIGVEDAIKELDFEQAIILRPGMILGDREKPKAPIAEKIVSNLHKISPGFQDSIGQDQKIIGRAAVAAARLAHEGKAPAKYWVLEQADVVKYGRDEWKE
ncbi:Protein FMP52, mitochondrial [Elsinoe australis]|uniref:Protein FMP52, mitochondrial n=1 Tax=Elsinoe australis TaxID=40998 RepID=A0A2P7YKY3_9PEZI|nr:Protein FMP52, mitochondrial [Elsinoe australis]